VKTRFPENCISIRRATCLAKLVFDICRCLAAAAFTSLRKCTQRIFRGIATENVAGARLVCSPRANQQESRVGFGKPLAPFICINKLIQTLARAKRKRWRVVTAGFESLLRSRSILVSASIADSLSRIRKSRDIFKRKRTPRVVKFKTRLAQVRIYIFIFNISVLREISIRR